MTGQNVAAATEAADQERKGSVLGEMRGPSAGMMVGGAGRAGGLPLPTVDSTTVCLAGAPPSAVNLDLLDQEVCGFLLSNVSSTCGKKQGLPHVIGREYRHPDLLLTGIN